MRWRVIAVLVAVLVLVAPRVAQAAANGDESTMAREIADDINRERVARHLPTIPVDGDYSAGAQRVAESNRDRPCHACHSADHPSGEVVWWGSDYPSSGSPIWWMGSPPHRALLLTPSATRLGVGVACNGKEHDAVAWIETQTEAQNAPATPVATKSGTGSRCHGTATTPGTGAPSRPSTSTAGGRTAPAITTTRVTAGTSPHSTTTLRRTTTSIVHAFALSGGSGVANRDAVSPGAEPELALRSVAGSRAASQPDGVGGYATAALLTTFIGVLFVGRATRRR
jgi:hypothetical protein